MRRFSVTEAALLLLLAICASKGLGVLRQSIFNSIFGTGAEATAYYAAFRLPDTIFNLIAGGALTHALLPMFVSYEKERGKLELWRLASLVFNILLVTLTAFVLVAEFLAPTFVTNLLVPGLPPNVKALTTTLTRIMLLQPLILGIGTIMTALLHSKRQFFPTAMVIVLYDFGLIAGLVVARFVPGVGIYGPTFGLLATAVCQVGVQIPALLKQGVRYTFTWNLKHPALRGVMRLLIPNVLSVAAASTGAIVITSFASYLPDRASIAAMHNAFLLFALPLTLVSQVIAVVLLPLLTTQAAYGRYIRLRWTALKIVGGSLLLSIPVATLIYFFGRPTIHILFQYGAFTAHATALTNLALIGYAVGLPGMAIGELTVLVFYALKDTRTPLFANVVAVAAQIGLAYFLLKHLNGTNAILALPLAASLTGTVQAAALCLILFVRLRGKVKMDMSLQRLRRRREHKQAVQNLAIDKRVTPLYQPAMQEYQQAIPEYQRILQQDPGNLRALAQWHIALMTNSDTELAPTLELLNYILLQLRTVGQRSYEMVMQEYTEAALAYPGNASIHFTLGQIHQYSGNFDRAIEAYIQAMRQPVLEAMARVGAAQCLLSEGRPDVAAQQLEQALYIVRQTSIGSTYARIWAVRPRKDDEEKEAPETEISRLLAKAYDRVKRQTLKQPVVLQATPPSPSQITAPLPRTASTSPLENGVGESAQEAETPSSQEAILIIPEGDADPFDELITVYLKRGLRDEAIEELHALELVYLRQDQWEEAGEVVRRIGLIYAEMGMIDEAMANLLRALELTPNNIELLRELVAFYIELEQNQEASQYQAMIARYYFEKQQVRDSVEALQELTAIDPSNYEAQDLLGQMYELVGEYEQASRLYKQLARSFPERAEVWEERLATMRELQTR